VTIQALPTDGDAPHAASRTRKQSSQIDASDTNASAAGHAVAVQNLAENVMILLMIELYTLLALAGVSVVLLAAGFGGFLSLAIIGL
jgi:hypothetical protein